MNKNKIRSNIISRVKKWTNPLELEIVRPMKLAIAKLIAIWFGAGKIPKAPGTAGAVAAFPLIFVFSELSIELKILAWSLIFLIGTWASKIYSESLDVSDHQSIVVDEVLGMGITTIFVATHDWKLLLVGFILFRIFDVIKPPPIRALDRWSKKKKGWSAAFGVMGDDLLAGLQGLATLWILIKLEVL